MIISVIFVLCLLCCVHDAQFELHDGRCVPGSGFGTWLGHSDKTTQFCGKAPCLKLNDGRYMPGFGLGTWLGFNEKGGKNPSGTALERAVEWAIDAGYRHIDTAFFYDTEREVGRAVNTKMKEKVIAREELFITTKLWNDRHGRNSVLPALRESLARLNLTYVDLYLIHCPIGAFPNGSLDNTDYVDTWLGMVEAQNLGLAKSIGVSNFNESMIDRIIAETGVKPANLQIEINLNLQQTELIAYCRRQGILVTGFTPFGSLFGGRDQSAPPPRVEDPELLQIARKYNKTVPQITLRYLVELGVVPIPKSVHENLIKENIEIFDFELDEDDGKKIKSYDNNYRTLPLEHWRHSPFYPF